MLSFNPRVPAQSCGSYSRSPAGMSPVLGFRLALQRVTPDKHACRGGSGTNNGNEDFGTLHEAFLKPAETEAHVSCIC